MERPPTYTLDEIERETGFDKRTIAYYVQEGLLPKVGRRGPRTRYSQSYLDRLLFVKKIREEQDRGRLGSLTLSHIRDMLNDLGEDAVADILAGRRELDTAAYEVEQEAIQTRMASRSARLDMLRQDTQRWMRAERERPSEPRLSAAEEPDALLLDLDNGPPQLELREVAARDDTVASKAPLRRHATRWRQRDRLAAVLEHLADKAGQRSRIRRRSSEHWTRAEITPDLVLTARDLDEEDADLLEEAARLLRWKILRGRRGEE